MCIRNVISLPIPIINIGTIIYQIFNGTKNDHFSRCCLYVGCYMAICYSPRGVVLHQLDTGTHKAQSADEIVWRKKKSYSHQTNYYCIYIFIRLIYCFSFLVWACNICFICFFFASADFVLFSPIDKSKSLISTQFTFTHSYSSHVCVSVLLLTDLCTQFSGGNFVLLCMHFQAVPQIMYRNICVWPSCAQRLPPAICTNSNGNSLHFVFFSFWVC